MDGLNNVLNHFAKIERVKSGEFSFVSGQSAEINRTDSIGNCAPILNYNFSYTTQFDLTDFTRSILRFKIQNFTYYSLISILDTLTHGAYGEPLVLISWRHSASCVSKLLQDNTNRRLICLVSKHSYRSRNGFAVCFSHICWLSSKSFNRCCVLFK